MKKQATRCCIVGGGPAGIVLGYLLARSGIDVVVLEKHKDFFRDFRGDTIHPSTMDVLHELGLLKDFLKLPHEKARRATGRIGGEEIPVVDFRFLRVRTPFVAFIPQWDFLNFLSEKGKKYPQFHLEMESEVIDVIENKGRVCGVTVKHHGKTFDVYADLVIGADGRDSIVREKAHLKVIKTGAPIDVLWFRLSRKPDDPNEFSANIGSDKMMVMINRGAYWQCAYVVAKGGFEKVKEGGLKAFREDIASLVSFTKDRVDEITQWDQVKLLSVTVDHLEKWYRQGLLCIGDAAHAMSPLGGVGINLAIQDAVAAANILVPAFADGIPTESDLSAIQKRREFPTRITQKFQTFVQDRVIIPQLTSDKTIRVPLPLRFFTWIPMLRVIPAWFVGVGVRPEHVETKEVAGNMMQ